MSRPHRAAAGYRGLTPVLVLMAVLCSCGDDPAHHAAPRHIDLMKQLSSAAFIAAEPALDLRYQAHMSGPPASPGLILSDGWWHTEKFGTWAVAQQVSILAYLPRAEPRDLVLECRPYTGTGDLPAQAITIEVNGRASGLIELEERWREYRIPLETTVLKTGSNRIVLSFRHQYTPPGQHKRKLSAGFRRVGLLDHTTSLEDALSAPLDLQHEQQGLLWTMPGTAVVPLHLGPGQNRLVVRGAAAQGTVALTARLLDLSGNATSVFATQTAQSGEKLRCEKTFELELDGGGLGLLALEASFDRGAALTLSEAFLDSPFPTQLEQEEPGPSSHRERSPDIVVLIPDALRADHLGCYGYHRPTSPHLDRLATESIVFTKVVSLASYTLCSVPTIMTGTSHLQHGLIDKDGVLPLRFTTLAEALKGVGYDTIAISANVYDSPLFGSHQGFDEFVEMWRYDTPEQNVSFDPHRLVDLATQRLRQRPGNRPLLLLIHFVPPHQPFQPTERFDLFGDPDYTGPVDGETATLHDIRSGRLTLSEADRQRLVALYDGNIRKVDDAIGHLLEVLRSRSRWDNTVVLVISDHGEAFFEHGVQGHVVDVYEEMIRVPFILRLPSKLRNGSPATNRLACLADVMPTLLGLAGVPSPPEVTGVDLLRPPSSQASARDRWLVCRNGGNTRHTYGVRTGALMAVVHELRKHELFDLDRDEGETHDLGQVQPVVLAGLSQLLREALLTQQEQETRELEVSEEETQQLRALGYY